MIDTAFGSSKVDFVTVSDVNIWNQYFSNEQGAVACVRNSAGQYPIENPYGPTGFNSGTIVSAQILVNPSSAVYNTTFKQDYMLRHELGHVMGLGHTPLNVISIMNPSENPTYNTVQTHDINDLNAFYPN